MSQYLGDISAYALAVSQGYTGTEEEYAELMASYATVGQTAVDAKDVAVAAKTAAQTAATTATNKASEATTAAQTATTKAGEASTSASTATSAKDTAVSASQTATSKATEATTAAATATSAASTATTAKDDAVSAKTAAQTAQTGAETARDAVQSSAAQIATNASDITALREDLTQKANADGSYDTLTAGTAKQILSNLEQTDMVPYNYRTAGGSLEIGDREKLKKIVGGSLAVNQLVTDPNFADAGSWGVSYGATFSVSDGVATITITDAEVYDSYIRFLVEGLSTHKYLFMGEYKVDTSYTGNALKFAVSGDTTSVIKNLPISANWSKADLIYQSSIDYGRVLIGKLGGRNTFAENDTISFRKFGLFDLTAMFGTTIADYVYSLEQATAGAGVAWLKSHFPRIFNAGYVPYNAGELVSVQASAHKMTGFNQWDEEWEYGDIDNTTGQNVPLQGLLRSKNYIPVIQGQTYYFKIGTSTGINVRTRWYDADKNYLGSSPAIGYNSTFVVPNNACYLRFTPQSSYGTTYNHDICINLHWGGERDGEYEPYEEHSYPLDSDVTLRGIPKLDANNNLYYDGDEYVADGTVTRKLIVHHISGDSIVSGVEEREGTKLWRLNITGFTYGANNQYKKGVVSNLYEMVTSYMAAYDTDKILAFNSNLGVQIIIHDSSVSSVDELKQKLNSTPIDVLYPLATPTTEEADHYTEIQNVSNWGTEEFVTTSLVPVGHETAYQPDLRAKIEVAPESPDGDGVYIMQRENGLNSYVALASSATIQDIISRLEALEGSGT